MLITSESVTEGHPDKLCDQIADAVLDEALRQDKFSRVACEVYLTMGLLIVGGEITTKGYIDIAKIARKVIAEAGYTDPKYGLDAKTCAVVSAIHTQSPDIAQGVDAGGAGDQGMMYGYATRETKEYLPLGISLAHQLTKRMSEVRKKQILNYLGPDGKAQVTVEYQGGLPKRVTDVVLACQHTEKILDKSGEKITARARAELIETIAKPVLGKWADSKTRYFVNETGKFVVGGPQSDTGANGRKNIVDSYGGNVPHGGGAFSGKDATKVDRSASYMARYVAKNVVAAGLAERCLVELAYVIGRAEPVAVNIQTFGTAQLSDRELVKLVKSTFDLSPQGIIKTLNLRRPIYQQTACYGHFGRPELNLPWEKIGKVNYLRNTK